MTNLLNLAIAILGGLLMTRLFSRWRLPDVTAFLVAGVLIGPFVLGRLHLGGFGFQTYEDVEQLSLISNVAMGFIAFSIGNEFRISDLRKTGKQALTIGVIQALVATLFVDIALVVFHLIRPDILSVPAAITLGAIASATAPAATLSVVKQYKAKGEVTSLLLPIVALDDAVGLVVFSVSFGIAKALISGSFDAISVILNPMIEITGSLLLGAVMGSILSWIEKYFHSNRNRLALMIGFIFITIALSSLEIELGSFKIAFSSLLTCMMLGTIFCNLCPLSEELMDSSDHWATPLLCAFFVISGAELRMETFAYPVLILVGVIYILARSLGKYFGTLGSATLSHCSPNVKKYLGITLLPQAGVALGMCVSAQALGGSDGPLIRNIVLFAVLIYELIGPILTRNALMKSGDIKAKPKEVEERRQKKLDSAEHKELREKWHLPHR